MVLAVFNAPVLARQLQQSLGSGLLGGQSGHGKDDLVGFFVHLAFA